MAEGPSTKWRQVTNTVCGQMIIVCRMLQNDPEHSFVRALKMNTLLLTREYVLFTSVNVVLHRLVCCGLTACRLLSASSLVAWLNEFVCRPQVTISEHTFSPTPFGRMCLVLKVRKIAFILLTVMSPPPFLLWLCQPDIVNTGTHIVGLVVVEWCVCEHSYQCMVQYRMFWDKGKAVEHHIQY